jgi:hypothetical protein
MYSPNRRVRFWEQEGHKWKTLQLKGRKYSHSAVRVGTLDSGDALGVIAAAQKALHRLGDPREAELAEPLGELSLAPNAKLGEVGSEQSLQRVDTPLPVGAQGCGLRLEGQRVCHSID